jgi:hypothetical protein
MRTVAAEAACPRCGVYATGDVPQRLAELLDFSLKVADALFVRERLIDQASRKASDYERIGLLPGRGCSF